MSGKYSKGFVLLERPVPPEKKNDITEKYQVVIDVAVTDEDHWIQRSELTLPGKHTLSQP